MACTGRHKAGPDRALVGAGLVPARLAITAIDD